MRKVLTVMLATLIVTLALLSTASANTVVYGQLFLPETSTIFITTRENRKITYESGMTKDQLNALYDADDELVAYIIYPHGPNCAIYDSPSSETAEQLEESGNVARDYYWWLDGAMIESGYEESETSYSCINGFYFVTNNATQGKRISSSYFTYYETGDGETRVILFNFDYYENIPVWRTYVENYMNMVSFKPGSVEFGSIVYVGI